MRDTSKAAIAVVNLTGSREVMVTSRRVHPSACAVRARWACGDHHHHVAVVVGDGQDLALGVVKAVLVWMGGPK